MTELPALLERMGFSPQTLKTAMAAAIAWLVSTAFTTSQYPYFAPLAAMLTVQVTIVDSLKAAVHRLMGIVIGVGIAIFVGQWLSIGAGSIFFITLIGMAVTSALHASPLVTSQVAISSLLVLAISKGPGYASARITETVIGSLIAILINAVVIPPNAVPTAEKRVSDLYSLAAATLNDLGALLYEKDIQENSGLDEVMRFVEQTEKGVESIRLAGQSLKYSPFPVTMRANLARLAVRMKRLEHITLQIRGIRKGLIDLRSTPCSLNDLESLKAALESTALCLANLGHYITHFTADDLSTLICTIKNARVQQSTCLALIRKSPSLDTLREFAGVLTDLNRILQEIEGEI